MHCEQDYLLEIVGQTESDVFLTQRLFQCYLLQFLPMAASSSGTSWPTAPHKLDVQFSRIQLSRRRYPLSGDGRDQRDKISKPEGTTSGSIKLVQRWRRITGSGYELLDERRIAD
jgi:hypothetical protein